MNGRDIDSFVVKRYYSILGVDSGSTIEQIKSAYRKLAKTVHPDLGGDPTRFRDIREAYETLCDPARKLAYDRELAAMPFDGEPFKSVEASIIAKPADVYDDVVDVIGRRMGMEKSSKLRGRVPISAADARDGVNLEIVIPLDVICTRCFGFGGTLISKCKKCGGKGTISVRRKVYATIEPGVTDGQKITGTTGKMTFTGIIEIMK